MGGREWTPEHWMTWREGGGGAGSANPFPAATHGIAPPSITVGTLADISGLSNAAAVTRSAAVAFAGIEKK